MKDTWNVADINIEEKYFISVVPILFANVERQILNDRKLTNCTTR